LALGATRTRLVRQLLTESLVLAMVGGTLALVINHWGRSLIPTFRSVYVAQDLPVVNIGLMPELDWRILSYVFGLSLLTGIVFGLVPALRATRIDLASDLKVSGRSISGEKSFLSKGLVIAQVAISLTLMVGAGLFLGTVRNLRNVGVGFNPHNILSFHLSLRGTAMNVMLDSYHAVYDHIVEKVAALPGVRSVGTTGVAYWQTQVVGSVPVFAEGVPQPIAADLVDATPGFFETMEIPLLSGRVMNFLDVGVPPKAVWINELAARRFFPGQEPIGRRMGGSAANAAVWQIAGVVGNTKYGDVRDAFRPTIYLPRPQTSFVVRTEGDPMKIAGSVIDIVRQIDPMIAITDTESEDSLLDGRIQTERLYASFYTLFGGIALALASIGLFGLMSYSVARRTNEIGVRMALGAQRGYVVRQLLVESLMLAGIGVLIGVLAALAAARLIASQLYEMAPYDLATFIGAIAVMFAVCVLAGYLPARRAVTIDPLQALRHE
jgi:predicted permease